MVVLGLDPSFTATGYAVLATQGSKQVLMCYGFLPLPAKHSMQQRIGMFHDFFTKLIPQYNVTCIALETPFLGKNAQTFLKLGYLRGTLYLLAHQHNLKIIEFSPREIKAQVAGSGAAQKDQVARVVHLLFPRLQSTASHDITDAIAVSLCGLSGLQSAELRSRESKSFGLKTDTVYDKF